MLTAARSSSARHWYRRICANRKSKSVEELLPWLYLKGISTGDFSEALAALLGPDAEGLSSSTITRLKATWWAEYETWRQRDLKGKRYVYIWADGVYFTPRLDGDRQCMLVIIGTDEYGEKDVLAITDGFRENADSWRDILNGLKKRGLSTPPELATGGFLRGQIFRSIPTDLKTISALWSPSAKSAAAPAVTAAAPAVTLSWGC
jgi:hypothetical protein